VGKWGTCVSPVKSGDTYKEYMSSVIPPENVIKWALIRMEYYA
jgi:hypothetical protein